MCFGGGGSDRSAEAAAEREARRRANINKGTIAIDEALAGFNDDFFTGRQDAFVQNATPSLDRDFQKAQRDLIFGISRS
jgi:hypothetical protein